MNHRNPKDWWDELWHEFLEPILIVIAVMSVLVLVGLYAGHSLHNWITR